MSTKYHRVGTLPNTPGWILVFASNISGDHLINKFSEIAFKEYGAELGVWNGLVGSSYAVPMFDHDEILSKDIREKNLKTLCKFIKDNKTMKFWITDDVINNNDIDMTWRAENISLPAYLT